LLVVAGLATERVVGSRAKRSRFGAAGHWHARCSSLKWAAERVLRRPGILEERSLAMKRRIMQDARVLDQQAVATSAARFRTDVAELRRPRDAKPKRRVATRRRREGLCSTCIHSAGCAYRARSNEPVVCCEEFSDSVRSALPERVEQPALVQDALGAARRDALASEQFKGLCMNCRHRDTCAFPKAGGGVWHCEVYEYD
jgi:hypothetical protein